MMEQAPTPNAERKRQVFFFAIVVFVVFAADQLSKYWLVIVYDMPHRAPVQVNDYFALVMAWNKGVSFSMLNSGGAMRWLLTFAAVAVSALLIRLALKTNNGLERIGYALVVGGALGNALDRARFGAVADFFYAHIGDLGWPAFNVADMGICAGVGLLLLSYVKPHRPA